MQLSLYAFFFFSETSGELSVIREGKQPPVVWTLTPSECPGSFICIFPGDFTKFLLPIIGQLFDASRFIYVGEPATSFVLSRRVLPHPSYSSESSKTGK
jgi:hypothetical protein